MRPVTIADRPVMQRYLTRFRQSVCELTFGNFFLWGKSRQHLWMEYEDHLLVSLQKKDEPQMWYQPIGPDPVKLMSEDLTLEKGFHWYCVDAAVAEKLPKAIPMRLTPERFDYVYGLPELRTLTGGDYSEKRNFIKRCRKHNPEVVMLDASHGPECHAMLEKWMSGNHEGMESARDEISALRLVMENFSAMELAGVGIRIGGEMQALAIGAPMTDTLFVEHFEKSTNAFSGLYALVFHEFAKVVPEKWTELNKEEDLGIQGLRTAKERWHPKYLVRKYMVG